MRRLADEMIVAQAPFAEGWLSQDLAVLAWGVGRAAFLRRLR